MKILILSNSIAGMLHFRIELMRELTRRDHQVYLDAPYDYSVESLNEFGVNTIECKVLEKHGRNPFKDLKILAHYSNIIERIKPNIVLTYTIKPNIYGGFVSFLKGIPFLANITGLGDAIESKTLFSSCLLRAYLFVLTRASVIFFQNKSNMHLFTSRGLEVNKCILLPGSGVNLERYQLTPYPSDDDGFVFLTAGRMVRDKGIDELLETAALIHERGVPCRFVLVGPADELYRDILSEHDSKGIIEYASFQEDIRPWIRDCHALIQPSYHEGMSNICLEAAAMGRPLIATLIPGCQETFIDGVTGMGFAVKNSDALINSIERFVSMPWEQRRSMGFLGHEKVSREFDRKLVVDRYIDAIERITQR